MAGPIWKVGDKLLRVGQDCMKRYGHSVVVFEILDMTPGSTGGFGDSALVVGQSFLDSTYGVNIIVTGATASAATVTVSKGGATASRCTGYSGVGEGRHGAGRGLSSPR